MFDTSVVFDRIIRLNEAVNEASSGEDRARCRSDLYDLRAYVMTHRQDIIDLPDGVVYLGQTLRFMSNTGFFLDKIEGRFGSYTPEKVR